MKGYADVNSFVAQMIPFVFVIKEIYHNNAWLVLLENILIIILDFFPTVCEYKFLVSLP